ncbi:DUF3427 domain-containing protein [Corynebacterium sp. L4756]|uniref:DUF3427 domain-containing protein n=1 Tax=unclassified Corynebacterium TaxID=2624378 RepID=UPI00374DAEC9
MSPKDSILPFGIYETPVNARIRQRLEHTKAGHPQAGIHIAKGADEDIASRYQTAVSRGIARVLEQRLNELDNAEDRLALINSITTVLGEDEAISSEELLSAIVDTELASPPALPTVPFHSTALFTNAVDETNMSTELAREIKTADSVDLLCAFVKNSGISVLSDQLEFLRDNQVPLRVITSTYCGATEATAVEALVKRYGAEVRVCYEHKSTRLHAKAWLFRRNSGFDTAFIGSSNLSRSALIDGWEWNVRGSSPTTPEIIDKFIKTFDSYWHDNHFKSFTPEKDFRRLEGSLAEARTGGKTQQRLELSGLHVEPYPYQQEMLESLEAERTVKDIHRNLLVAATGTGKTVVAALDYRAMCENIGRRPRLLFVAHQKRILLQAQRTYREVLRDSSFGEMLVGGERPRDWEHVFASVQSLKRQVLDGLAPDRFDVVVIDEFHHAEASTYQRILDHLQPTELLGLTATPERTDGENVQKFFNYRVAHELRLWDALHLQLLTPMHYYGIADGTDLTGLTWSRTKKGYDTRELSELYIHAGEKRTKFIINEIEKRVIDVTNLRALGFCVSIDHARFMAQQFTKFGLPARAIHGQTPASEREAAIRDLREGRLKTIFSVDLFNEGIDIPEVNTLLLLRPSQSPVLFIQQLGRGLRLANGKDSCVVLDFIGQQHQQFDFTDRYQALTKKRGKNLEREVEQGFASMPAGSNISLDAVTQDQVLRNIRSAASNSLKKIKALVADIRTTDLSEFLDQAGVSISDIYKTRSSNQYSWTRFLREAELLDDRADETEEFLLKRLRTMLHINDRHRAQMYSRLMDPQGPDPEVLSEEEKTYARMLVLSFWAGQRTNLPADFPAALKILRRYPAVAKELRLIMEYSINASRVIPQSSHVSVLLSHAEYSLAELMGALETKPLNKMVSLPREGVRYINRLQTDLFLVTFKKREGISASTDYRDYPISPELLHWESQSRTSLDSDAGQRYIHHKERGSTIAMATRFHQDNEVGTASAYTFLGKVDYVSHHGEKPIQFEWALKRSMPKKVFVDGRTVA